MLYPVHRRLPLLFPVCSFSDGFFREVRLHFNQSIHLHLGDRHRCIHLLCTLLVNKTCGFLESAYVKGANAPFTLPSA